MGYFPLKVPRHPSYDDDWTFQQELISGVEHLTLRRGPTLILTFTAQGVWDVDLQEVIDARESVAKLQYRLLALDTVARSLAGEIAAPGADDEAHYSRPTSAIAGAGVGRAEKASELQAALLNATAIYYVSSSGGNDANDGLTPATAKQTLASVTLAANTAILLKRGDTWTGQSIEIDAAGVNDITVAAYGAGARPVLDTRQTLASGNWTKTAGRTNVYEQTVTIEVHTVTSHLLMWEDGDPMTLYSDLADVDSNAGSYGVSAHTGGGSGYSDQSITVYIHATGSGDPASNGKTYQAPRRHRAIDGQDRDNLLVCDVKGIGATADSGAIRVGDNSRIYNCRVDDCHKHHFFIKSGVIADCYGYRSRPATTGTMFVANANTPTGSVRYSRCTAVNDAYDGITSGFNAHNNTSGTWTQIRYEDCHGENLTRLFGSSDDADEVIAVNCTAWASWGFMLFGNSAAQRVRGGWWRGWTGGGVPRAFSANQSGPVDIEIDGFSICYPIGATFNGSPIHTQYNNNWTITHTRFSCESQAGLRPAIQSNDASVSWTLNNNHFGGDWGTYYDFITAPGSLTSDNNWFEDGTTTMRIGGTTYSGATAVADYVAGESQDANSVIGRADVSGACR